MKIKLNQSANNEAGQSMSAMTDVVFLLLVFFIVTASAFARTVLLDTALPLEGSGGITEKTPVTIEVLAREESETSGEYLINGIKHSELDLHDMFGRYSLLMPDAEFVIRCDEESLHGDFVSVLAIAAEKGVGKISLMRPKSK